MTQKLALESANCSTGRTIQRYFPNFTISPLVNEVILSGGMEDSLSMTKTYHFLSTTERLEKYKNFLKENPSEN
jgi:hypothetical protein